MRPTTFVARTRQRYLTLGLRSNDSPKDAHPWKLLVCT